MGDPEVSDEELTKAESAEENEGYEVDDMEIYGCWEPGIGWIWEDRKGRDRP